LPMPSASMKMTHAGGRSTCFASLSPGSTPGWSMSGTHWFDLRTFPAGSPRRVFN